MPAAVYPTVAAAYAGLRANGVTDTIVQRGDATGDQSHVLPVMAVHANHGVLVIDGMKQMPRRRRPCRPRPGA